MKTFKTLLNEILTPKMPVKDWIRDFVHSNNPKFEGKTKLERIKMAIAAHYASQKKKKSK